MRPREKIEVDLLGFTAVLFLNSSSHPVFRASFFPAVKPIFLTNSSNQSVFALSSASHYRLRRPRLLFPALGAPPLIEELGQLLATASAYIGKMWNLYYPSSQGCNPKEN